jgi:hypothetical protein
MASTARAVLFNNIAAILAGGVLATGAIMLVASKFEDSVTYTAVSQSQSTLKNGPYKTDETRFERSKQDNRIGLIAIASGSGILALTILRNNRWNRPCGPMP